MIGSIAKTLLTPLSAVKGGYQGYKAAKATGKVAELGGFARTAFRLGVSGAAAYAGYKAVGSMGSSYVASRRSMYDVSEEGKERFQRTANAYAGLAATAAGVGSWYLTRRASTVSKPGNFLSRAAVSSVASVSSGGRKINTLAGRVTGAGIVIGGGTAVYENSTSSNRSGPGKIIGIQSHRGHSGISPELQYSTLGLTLGIHSKRKRRRI